MEEKKINLKEQIEAFQDEQAIAEDTWLDGVADFKMEKPSFDFTEFEKRSRVLKEAFNDVNGYVKKFEDCKQSQKEKREYEKLTDTSTISEAIADLEKSRNDLMDKSRKILGSIYSGQLIDEKLTARRGNFYFYRGRHKLNTNRILDIIIEHKDEVAKKLTPEQQEVLAYIFNCASAMGNKHNERTAQYYETLNSRKMFPINFILTIPETNYRGGEFTDYDIRGMELNYQGIKFIDKNTKDGEERVVDVDSFAEIHLIQQNKDLIIEAKKELQAKVEAEKTKLDFYINEMKDKFAKVLVLRKFQEENEDEYS